MINPFKNATSLQIITSVGIWLNLTLNVIQFQTPQRVTLLTVSEKSELQT